MARSDAVSAVSGALFREGWSKIRGGAGAQARRHRQITRAARGHSPAVFKPVKRGGCRTRPQLVGQLSYLTTKASHIIDSRSVHDGAGHLDAEQIGDIADRFSEAWDERFSPKLGHTTHMIMAFPIGTKGEDVRDMASEVCERFFMQEGRQFDYIVAIHEDRAHPHAHVVLNRRSAEGELFYLGRDHHFNYDDIRQAMVEAGERHGVRLEASRRLDRGVASYSPSKSEVYLAKKEGRDPIPRERVGADLERALAEIARTAELYRSLATAASRERREDVAQALHRASTLLGRGEALKPDGVIYMTEAQSVDDLRSTFSDLADRAETMAEGLPPERRAAVERELSEIYAGISHMQPLGAGSDSLTAPPTETGVYADSNIDSAGLDRLAAPQTRAQIEHALEGTGISADTVVARLETGANSAALERQWLTDDLQRIAEQDGLELTRDADLQWAVDRLDAVHVQLGETLHEAQVLHDPGIREEVDALIEPGDSASASAAVLAAMRQDSARDPFVSEETRDAFRAEIEAQLDDDQIDALKGGDAAALAGVFDDRLDRLYAAKAYLQADTATAGGAVMQEINHAIADEEVDAARLRHTARDSDTGPTHG